MMINLTITPAQAAILWALCDSPSDQARDTIANCQQPVRDPQGETIDFDHQLATIGRLVAPVAARVLEC